MYILIAYDVDTNTPEGRTRLRKVAKCCLDYGQRVQNSVFECSVSQSDLLIFRNKLKQIINSSTDSVRIYRLGKDYHNKIEIIGKETAFDMDGDLII